MTDRVDVKGSSNILRVSKEGKGKESRLLYTVFCESILVRIKRGNKFLLSFFNPSQTTAGRYPDTWKDVAHLTH